MDINKLEVGKTYLGKIDYKRGLGPKRTLLEIDTKYGIVMLRNEVGENPPDCYISLCTAKIDDFALWAQEETTLP